MKQSCSIAFWGCQVGAAVGGGDNLPTAGNGVTFDDVDAVANFAKQLGPPPTVSATQTQREQGIPLPPAIPALGVPLPPAAPAVGGGINPPPPPPQQAGVAGLGGGQQPPGDAAYSGINSVLRKLGHTMYDPATIEAELSVQLRGTPGDLANQTAFRNFVVNVQQFRVYLAMLGGQTHIPMIHTPGVYYSIASATSTYQGKVLAFIGDRRATREPTLICLPTSKSWEWHTGNAVTDFDKFSEFYDVEANKGTLWTPAAGNGAPAKLNLGCLSISYTRSAWRSRHTTYWHL